MQGRATVFIACCNRLLRESVARILGKRGGLEILAAQAPSSTSWEEIGDSGADVLVLDSLEFLLRNPVLSSKACALRCSSKCVLIAMTDDHNNFLMAVQRGARGYVLQDASAIDVVSAICTVAEGRVVCPPQYAQVLFDFVATQTAELPNSRRRARWGLTRREQQLIPLIGRGLSNKEIANHLSLSEQTVKNHIHRIFRKMGISDRLSVFEACQTQAPAVSTKNAGTQSRPDPLLRTPK